MVDPIYLRLNIKINDIILFFLRQTTFFYSFRLFLDLLNRLNHVITIFTRFNLKLRLGKESIKNVSRHPTRPRLNDTIKEFRTTCTIFLGLKEQHCLIFF